jgi:hypothetical protein
MGTSFVSLTTAALHDVAPEDAGAASGLINVMQQLGAALGLAVLVTVFDGVGSRSGANGLSATATVVHGIDVTFGVAALFALAALAIVVFVVRTPSSVPAAEPSAEMADTAETAETMRELEAA